MRTILIADDERIEREGIKFLLKESGFELQVVEAVHGKAALEYLKHNKVDILFTDIKMPFMDGLQLIQEAILLYPDLKCVVFSGFSEFEYAKEAIRMGVNNYILKPVDLDEFTKTIKEVFNELNKQDLQEKIRQKKNSYLWDHILYQLVNGISLEAIQDRTDFMLDKNSFTMYHRMILIESNHNFFERVNEIFSYELKTNLQLQFDYLNLNMQQSILLFKKTLSVDYELLAQNIYKFIKENYQKSCYVAVSRSFKNISEIGEVFLQLEELMEEKFYQPDDHVFMVGKNSSVFTKTKSEDELINLIHKDIRNKNIEGLKKNYETLCNKYQEQTSFSQIFIKFIFSNIMKEVSAVLAFNNENKLEKEIEELYKSTKMQDVIEITNRYIERFIKSFNNPGMRTEIQAIKSYIYENYQEDISIQLLAEQVCLTPSYLSYIFKKETGCNLNKFIKAYRMDKAKELLKCTQMKIVHICELVGYTNVSYFCQNFKDSFGVSPEKYRQSGEVNEKEKTI